MAMVELKQLRKVYTKDAPPAVCSLDLQIEDGEFVVMVGPSGCGKTTTLRMIAGLERASSGCITIDGRDVTALEPKDRNVAMVFQNYALYPTMSVYENIAFALKSGKPGAGKDGTRRRISRKEIDEKVHAVAEQLDLTRLLKRKPRELSGGEKQRVALARAMVRDPLIFLMDEPLSNLDAQLRTQTRSEIMKLHNKLKSVFIYVTHDQVEAMTMGEKIVVMNKGEVQQIGTPYEIFYHPANLFVAGFIGAPTMNFFDAKFQKCGDGMQVDIGENCVIRLPEETTSGLSERDFDGEPVILGCRPEHTKLTEKKDGSLELPVLLQEITGSEMILRSEYHERRIAVSTAFNGKPQAETMYLTVDPEHIYLFDPASGRNLLGCPEEEKKA